MDQMKQAFRQIGPPQQSTPPARDNVAVTIDGLRLNTHQKVLVVGVKGDNLPEQYRQHPQIIAWETDGKIVAENMPAAVKLVLTTRFIGHPSLIAIRKVAEARGVLFPTRAYSTGEIRQLLAPLLGRHVNGATVEVAIPKRAEVAEKVATVKPPEPKRPELRKFGKGGVTLTLFVGVNGDPFRKPYDVEALRLLKVAESQGYETTAASIAQAMYVLRKERVAQAELPKPEELAASPRLLPEPVPAPVAKPSTLSDDDQEIMRMLDDANKQLADVQAALGLIRQEIVQRAARRRKVLELAREIEKGL